MNERIKELIEQAGPLQEVLSMIHEQTNNIGPRYIRNLALLDFQLERFAELIVRECVQTLLDNTPDQFTNEAAEEDWDRGYDQAMRDCVHHIQEHFGVE